MKEFFFCSNPLVTFKAGTGYFFHSVKPRYHAAFFTIDATKDFNHINYPGRNVFVVYSRGDGELILFLLLVLQNIDRATTKLDASLSEAAAWFVTCQNLEDEKRFGKKGSYHFPTEYNVLTPGLSILHLEASNKYLVSYEGGVKSFDDAVAMDKFLVSVGYNNLQLEMGHQNIFNPRAKRK